MKISHDFCPLRNLRQYILHDFIKVVSLLVLLTSVTIEGLLQSYAIIKYPKTIIPGNEAPAPVYITSLLF